MSQTPLIALAERLYRVLLILYPVHYRQEYGALMVQVFRDMSRASYHERGFIGLALWWCSTLIDLFRTVIEQRRALIMSKSTLMSAKTAAMISLLLCLPISFLFVAVVFDVKPPFISQTEPLLFEEYRPTLLGIITLFGLLFSLPAAFLINLLAMIAKAGSAPVTPFKPTLTHAVVGVSSLCFVLFTLARQVLYELRPFVNPLGSNSHLGNLLFLLGLLVLPVAFLLNRLPRFRKVGAIGGLTFQPTSMNLIIGATILLMMLMIVSTFMLETIACTSGVPNCD